tara:strand:- start:5492 stop:5878 length:387 start_codon:yes stop_codon:yes gene_type:complete
MANNTITFDPAAGVAYGVNLSIFAGADFRSSFHVKNNDSTNFDFTDFSGSSQMTKSVSVGSSSVAIASFNIGFTSATSGQFEISLGSTQTRPISPGRYVYDILVSSGSSLYRLAEGYVLVQGGISSAP